jgi:hypothetical protein
MTDSKKPEPEGTRKLRVISNTVARQTSEVYDYHYQDFTGEKKSDPISLRLDLTMAEQVAVIVQSGKTTFRKNTELIKAAVHYFITKEIAPRMDKRFQDDHRIIEQRIHRLRQMERIHDVARLVKEAENVTASLKHQGFKEEAKEALQEVFADAARLSEPQRSVALTRLRASDSMRKLIEELDKEGVLP